MVMKNFLIVVLFGLLNTSSQAQEAFLRLLVIEPSHANGYFILDQNKMQREGVSKVDVIALVDKILPGGQMERRTLTRIEIDNGHFAKLDPAHLIGLTADETVHYQLIGRTTTGDVIVDVAEIPVGDWAWPAVCRVNCESAGYAWSLTGFSNGAQTFIDLQNGSADGVPFYFYVPALCGSILSSKTHHPILASAQTGTFLKSKQLTRLGINRNGKLSALMGSLAGSAC